MSEQNENNQGQNTENKENSKDAASSVKEFIDSTKDSTAEFDPADIEKNKTVSGLAYILFFLPLIVCPDSKYGRFHANQGLILLLVSIAGNIILSIIPFLGGILTMIYGILMFVLFVIGLLNGLNGKAKELPVIGSIKLLK